MRLAHIRKWWFKTIINIYIGQDGETALHKACKMCNYDVLKCVIDFAKQHKAEHFKQYINAVNVKVK